jgi:hypothetical protein
MDFGELAKVYGIHRTTVCAHVARAGKTRGQLTEARVDEAVRLYGQGCPCERSATA